MGFGSAIGGGGDDPSVARNFTSKIDGITARSLGSNQYRIDATSSRVLGVREIPAGTTGLVGDSTGSLESGFARIDQGLDGVKGITFDAAGNAYLSLAGNSTSWLPSNCVLETMIEAPGV